EPGQVRVDEEESVAVRGARGADDPAVRSLTESLVRRNGGELELRRPDSRRKHEPVLVIVEADEREGKPRLDPGEQLGANGGMRRQIVVDPRGEPIDDTAHMGV